MGIFRCKEVIMAQSKYLRLPQYEVGKYPKNQLEKIQMLFSQAFGGRTESLEMLQWQMEKNPCLQERATALWQGNTLVAYNALTPHPTFLRGKEVISAVSGTTMADEHFPGASLQLFTECAKQNQDIAIIIGFSNHNSYSITVKYLGHHYVGDVAFWTTEAKPIKTADKIREFFEFTDEYQEISRKLSKTHDFIKTREKNFLNWRFFQKPEFEYKGYEYQKRGYIVVDTYTENNIKQLQIVDVIADSEEVMEELLKYAINLAYDWNCPYVKLWLTSMQYKKLLEKSGFIYGEHPFAMTVWDQDLDISNSYITMMDSDIF